MSEKQTFKRFDTVSVLAVLSVLLVLVFESFFIFEVYRVDYAKIEPYLPGVMKEWFAPPAVPVTDSAAEDAVPDDMKPVAPVEEKTVSSTNAVPDASEEPETVPADAEPVPVG